MVSGYATFSAQWDKNGTKEAWRVPMVLDIETTYNSSLVEKPTMIYGVENNFVMDLGTVRQFTLSCARVHAGNVSDDDEHGDLSNGDWIKGFRDFWDHWQNLSYEDGRIQGGAGFTFTPEFAQDADASDGDADLIPPITTNVFLMGSISPTYGVQKMTWSMQLLEARVFSEGSDARRVTMTFDVTYGGETKSQVKSYPIGSQFRMPNPTSEQSSMLKDGSIVVGWRKDGVTYEFGTAIVAEERMDGWTFTAVLKSPKAAVVRCLYHNANSNDLVVPDGCTKANVVLVGAGGKCGDSKNQDDSSTKERYTGGGGGSGETKQFTFTGLTGGDKVTVTVGDGLFNIGSSGKSTTIKIITQTGTVQGSVSGGRAGSDATDARKGAVGGTIYNRGGSSPQSGAKGGDGEGDIGIPGKGGEPGTRSNGSTLYGGCGGGAADLKMYVSKKALIASGEYTTNNSLSEDWDHGQLGQSKSALAYSPNITVTKNENDRFLADYHFRGTVSDEGPFYYLIQITDATNKKKLYRGLAGFYIKDDTDTSGSYLIQSKGGDGKSGADSGEGPAHGYMGGGGGSNGNSGYGGDGVAIFYFFD